MFIKINKEKVKYSGILNGEPVLLKLETVKGDATSIVLGIAFYVESDYLQNRASSGVVEGIENPISVETQSKHYSTVGVKLAKEKLIQDLGLVDADLTILAEAEWKHPAQTIRLTIPVDEVVENEYYRNLVGGLIADDVIKYKVDDNYILYLSYIDDANRPTLEADENILIEE